MPVLIIVYTAYRRIGFLGDPDVLRGYLTMYALPLAGIFITTTCLARTKKDIQGPAVVTILAAIFAIYAAEFYLEKTQGRNPLSRDIKISAAAKRMGLEYDKRSANQIASEMRSQGVRAYPFFLIHNQPGGLLPLGNVPNSTIVHCNEVGQRMVFKSDRHGFNNPDAIWDHVPIDILFVGDSFTHGSCSPNNRGFANLLRRDDSKVANVAVGGNNPLTNLASIIEYAPVLRPKKIIWVHYSGNDLIGMMADKPHPVLRRYVQEEFSQNLAGRRNEIEDFMAKFYEEKYLTRKKQARTGLRRRRGFSYHLVYFLKLTKLRTSLGLTEWIGENIDYSLLTDVLRKAKQVTDRLDAELIIVRMPPVTAFGTRNSPAHRGTVTAIQKIGIKYYDGKLAFSGLDNPSQYYAFGRNGGHLNDAGNVVFAKYLRDTVLKDESSKAARPPK